MAALRMVKPMENISEDELEASSFVPIYNLTISSGARYVFSLSKVFWKLVLSLGQLSKLATLISAWELRKIF